MGGRGRLQAVVVLRAGSPVIEKRTIQTDSPGDHCHEGVRPDEMPKPTPGRTKVQKEQFPEVIYQHIKRIPSGAHAYGPRRTPPL